jgi:hypothetical protein
MDPFTLALMAGSTALGIGGQIIGARGQKDAAELNAFNIETESLLVKAQGLDQGNRLRQSFKETMASAEAIFAAFGRDASDPSVQAYKKKEMYTLGKDISDISMMTTLNQLKLKQQASDERLRGKQAMTAGYLGAGRSLLKFGMDYQDLK